MNCRMCVNLHTFIVSDLNIIDYFCFLLETTTPFSLLLALIFLSTCYINALVYQKENQNLPLIKLSVTSLKPG